MTYKEAIEYSLKVKWKTTTCDSGDKCWCRGIEPEKKIIDDNDNAIYVVSTGNILKEHAEYIVQLHNQNL